MKLLLAALRESATTTLKKGRLLAPPRERRITTMMNDRVEKGVILRELRGGWQGKSGLESEADRLRAILVRQKTSRCRIMPPMGTRRDSGNVDIRNQAAYGLAEAARYLKLPAPTLRSWVVGRAYPKADGVGHFQPLIHPP